MSNAIITISFRRNCVTATVTNCYCKCLRFAELFDAEVERVLGIHAPLQTRRRRRGQHDTRRSTPMKPGRPNSCVVDLNVGTVVPVMAKSLIDRRAYRSGCSAARDTDSIQRSRADHIKYKLDAVHVW